MQEISVYCSRKTFDVARIIGAVWVFLCHCSYFVHSNFGIFDVAIFFFISGFGMEISSSRERSLVRLPRFIASFCFFAVIYYVVYSSTFFPTAWYLLTYSVLMVLYRFFSRSTVCFTLAFLGLVLFFRLLEFHYYYWTCPFAFLMGFYCARYRIFFSWFFSIVSFSICFFIFYFNDFIFFIFAFPLFFRILLYIASRPCFSFLSDYSFLVFPFFSFHCFVLGFFDNTWVYDVVLVDRSFDLFYSALSFVLALFGAYLLWRFVPVFSKKKFWIFQ